MDNTELFTGTRWEIIRELSKSSKSETELAKVLKTSLPNISQQIRLLEAFGIVRKGRVEVKSKKPGKPKKVYSITKPFASIVYVTKNFAEKLFPEMTDANQIMFNSLFALKEQDSLFMIKHLFLNDEIILNSQGVGLIKSSSTEIEIVIVSDNFEAIRKKFSNVPINIFGSEKKIISWTHSLDELAAGLQRKEDYFMQLTKKIIPIYETDDVFKKIGVMRNEQAK